MPSYPYKPTPICASYIIFTSFAPSPIANVIYFKFYFTNFTTYAFYTGVIRKQITLSHDFIIARNVFSNLKLSKISFKFSPLIKSAFFLPIRFIYSVICKISYN